MENVKVDQYGNVMVKRADGVWIRDTTLTNKIKNALKRNTTGKIIGETISGVKVTRGLVGQVNKKVLIEQKGRGVTSSLKQETGEKVTWSKSKSFESGQGNVGSGRVKVEGKPLYKDSQYRGTPKGPPKTAAARAKLKPLLLRRLAKKHNASRLLSMKYLEKLLMVKHK
jgi:hypothetical protein